MLTACDDGGELFEKTVSGKRGNKGADEARGYVNGQCLGRYGWWTMGMMRLGVEQVRLGRGEQDFCEMDESCVLRRLKQEERRRRKTLTLPREEPPFYTFSTASPVNKNSRSRDPEDKRC